MAGDQPNSGSLSKIVIASLYPHLWLKLLLCYYLSWLIYHERFSIFWNLTAATKKIWRKRIYIDHIYVKKHIEEGGTNLNTLLDLFLESWENRLDHWTRQSIMYIARVLQYFYSLTLRLHWTNQNLHNCNISLSNICVSSYATECLWDWNKYQTTKFPKEGNTFILYSISTDAPHWHKKHSSTNFWVPFWSWKNSNVGINTF